MIAAPLKAGKTGVSAWLTWHHVHHRQKVLIWDHEGDRVESYLNATRAILRNEGNTDFPSEVTTYDAAMNIYHSSICKDLKVVGWKNGDKPATVYVEDLCKWIGEHEKESGSFYPIKIIDYADRLSTRNPEQQRKQSYEQQEYIINYLQSWAARNGSMMYVFVQFSKEGVGRSQQGVGKSSRGPSPATDPFDITKFGGSVKRVQHAQIVCELRKDEKNLKSYLIWGMIRNGAAPFRMEFDYHPARTITQPGKTTGNKRGTLRLVGQVPLSEVVKEKEQQKETTSKALSDDISLIFAGCWGTKAPLIHVGGSVFDLDLDAEDGGNRHQGNRRIPVSKIREVLAKAHDKTPAQISHDETFKTLMKSFRQGHNFIVDAYSSSKDVQFIY